MTKHKKNSVGFCNIMKMTIISGDDRFPLKHIVLAWTVESSIMILIGKFQLPEELIYLPSMCSVQPAWQADQHDIGY
jgi:hypothetical protein